MTDRPPTAPCPRKCGRELPVLAPNEVAGYTYEDSYCTECFHTIPKWLVDEQQFEHDRRVKAENS